MFGRCGFVCFLISPFVKHKLSALKGSGLGIPEPWVSPFLSPSCLFPALCRRAEIKPNTGGAGPEQGGQERRRAALTLPECVPPQPLSQELGKTGAAGPLPSSPALPHPSDALGWPGCGRSVPLIPRLPPRPTPLLIPKPMTQWTGREVGDLSPSRRNRKEPSGCAPGHAFPGSAEPHGPLVEKQRASEAEMKPGT